MIVTACVVVGCESKKTSAPSETTATTKTTPDANPAASLSGKQPYYVVYSEGDAAVGYTFFDPAKEDARVVVVRPASDPIDADFEKAYDEAHEAKHTSQQEGLAGFSFPEPVYTSLEALAKGEPELAKKMGATNMAELIEHLRNARKTHGTLHDRYEGWFDPDPFEKLESEPRFWRRANGRLVPDMTQVKLPAYDDAKATLTYFTVKNSPPEGQKQYARPYTSRYVAWKYTVDFSQAPWVFSEPERIPDVDVRASEREAVDEAFGGEVGLFHAMHAPGVGELLLNLDEEKKAKRFVMVDTERKVLGTYDELTAAMDAHPGLDRDEFQRRFLDFVNNTLGRTGTSVIHDAEVWRSGFGKEVKERVGPPQFTMQGDESEYRIVPAKPAPSYADEVKDPLFEGQEVVYYAKDRNDTVFRVRVDTLALMERTSKKGVQLGVEE